MKIKKLSGLLLAGMLAVSMGTCAFAELQAVPTPDTGFTVTISNTTNDKATHTYEAFQIFKGKLAKDTEQGNKLVLSDIEWGSGINSASFLTDLIAYNSTSFKEGMSAADVADAIAELSEKDANSPAKIAEIANKWATTAAVTNVSPLTITAPGYYLVRDKDDKAPANSAATKYMLQVVGNQELVEKTDVPTIEKKIDGSKDNDSQTGKTPETRLVDADTVSVGSKVPYEVTSYVPDMTNYEKYYFIVEDKMTEGLTFDNDVAITIYDKSETTKVVKTLKKDTDFTVTTKTIDGLNGFEIVFKNFIDYKELAGDKIVITYHATVNEKAKQNTESNDNDARLIYSNNPNKKGEGVDKPNDNEKTEVTGETPWDKVKTYTIGIKLTKENEEGQKLKGAKFGIEGTKVSEVIVNKVIFEKAAEGTTGEYYRLKDGTYTDVKPGTVIEGKEVDTSNYESTTVTYNKVKTVDKTTDTTKVVKDAWVDADSVVTFGGLSEGTYTITELVSPEGYNILKDPMTVIISYTIDDETGEITWKADDGTKEGMSLITDTDAKNYFNKKIINRKGSFLPSTGGMGTTILYIVALAVGVISFVGRKVMKRSAAK